MGFIKTFKTAILAALVVGFTLPVAAQNFQPWMHEDVQWAWKRGFHGQNVRITTIDGFDESYQWSTLTGFWAWTSHGGWTTAQSSMIAPLAQVRTQDFSDTSKVSLSSSRLNILNLSYGMIGNVGFGEVNWSDRERSIIKAARKDRAVVVQAAGNQGNRMGDSYIDQNGNERFDYLSRDLAGLRGTLFVGALERNGSVDNPARLAAYSARAGKDKAYRNKFLVVGVPTDLHGLAGTSFAAPIVSGYAAILGSKFTDARPRDIARQLLDTARTDTIHKYKRSRHGAGEASLRRALAPNSIR